MHGSHGKYKKTFGIIAISFLELIGQNDEF